MQPVLRHPGDLLLALREATAWLTPWSQKLWSAAAVVWVLGLVYLALRRQRLTDPGPNRDGAFLALLLLGCLLLRLPALGLEEQNTDEGQWVASTATLAADPRFWVSVDGTTSGPLNVYPLLLPALLGLDIDYATVRLAGLLLGLLPAVALLFLAFRNLVGPSARLAILPLAVAVALVGEPDGLAYNSEHFPSALLAAACWLLSGPWAAARTPGPGRAWLIGLVLGCLPYTKLQSVPPALGLAGAAFLWLVTCRDWKALGSLVLGGLLPTAGIVGYVLAVGEAEFVYRSFILANLGYAQTGSFGHGVYSWPDKFRLLLPLIYGGFTVNRPFFLLLPLLALGGIGLTLRPGLPVRQRWLLGFGLMWLLTAVYATLQPGNRFFHYQILAWVPAYALGGLVLGLSPERFRGTLNAIWLAVLVMGPGISLALQRNRGIDQLAQPPVSPYRDLTATINRYAPPGGRMVVWGWLNRLHPETGLRLGTRFIPLYYPVVPGPEQAYFLSVYERDLRANRPAVFVDVTPLFRAYQPYRPERYPGIWRLLQTDYRLVATVDSVRVWRLKVD